MRILFISASPIQNENSIGNTFLNLFSGMDDVEIASVCTKTGKPDLSIFRCFCITEGMIIRNLLGKGAAGVEMDYSSDSILPTPETKTSSSISFVKRSRWTIFFILQDLLWLVGRWKSEQLKKFLKDYQPDIIFTVLSEKKYLNRLILYISNLTNKKLVVYAWDNNYSLKRFCLSPLAWMQHFCNRYYMRKVVKKADKLYVISELQKKDYEKAFKRSCTVITKLEDFSEPAPIKTCFSYPLKMVYTGNLYANRWKSLKVLVDVLERINRDTTKVQLNIYTATSLPKTIQKDLERDGTSYFRGCVSQNEIKKIQKDADILVYTEPTDFKNSLTVRQSFSTKIVDYFKSARPIVAVGSKKVASIKYILEQECAIVADNEQELYEKLSSVIDDNQQLQTYAMKSYMCGRRNHDKKQQAELHQILIELAEM